MKLNGLSLAAKKTEALLIARTKKRKYATFTVKDRKITTAETLKYLGVILDARRLFKEHLLRARLTAFKVARVLAGIMPNIGRVEQSTIWTDALSSNGSYGTTAQRTCRTARLRVDNAYCTVSDIALSVIAEMPPIDLVAAEIAKMHRDGKHNEGDDVNQEQSHNR